MHCPKRTISLVLSVLLLMCFSYSFADSAVTYDAGQRSIHVSYNGCSSNEQYMLFFIKDGASASALSGSDIYFMDQIAADDSGRISLLYIGPEFSSCQIVISGSFPNGGASPRMIGRFPAEGEFRMLMLPQGLIQIEEEAFEGGNFTHVYLSAAVQSIGSKAFANCPNLIYIEIPTDIESIADNAFLNSPNVVIGCTAGSKAYQYAMQKGIPYQIREQ